ncbi:MAG TPA: NmrA family NAD(P)-binding protein, partial [Anaerolineales bacterium]
MILITGAGGKTGRALIKALSKVESVCAFVRSAEHVPAVKSLGATEVIVGDLRDASALRGALKGARAIYHMCPNMSPDELAIGRLIIAESRGAAVEHFVFHSVLHPQIEEMPHHWDKLRVEELLFESGLPFTILRPAPYMQNLLSGWKKIMEEGIFQVPYAVETRLSLVDLEDVAAAAVAVLSESGHLYSTYELTGTLPLSQGEV